MNRRSLFKWLGVGTAAVVVAPSVIEKIVEPKPSDCDCALRSFWDGPCEYHLNNWKRNHGGLQSASVGGEYADYTNFSDFAVQSSVNDMVSNAAADLGRQAGLHVSDLWKVIFGN